MKTPKRVKPPYPPVVAKEFQEACRAANAAGPVGSPGQPGYVSDTAPIEQVDHPPHYGVAEDVYETIKVIEAWDLGFCLGNAVKYISRAGKKGSKIEDLEKARWYVDREISRLKNGEKEQG